MNQTTDQHANRGWVHVLPVIVIGALAITLWRPGVDPPPSPDQEAKIADLAARLGSPASSAEAIDDRLQSLGRFPPEATASRALADALVMCGTAGLDASQRQRLSRQLYGITVIGDSRAEAVPAALLGIQQTAAAAGCSPAGIDALMIAARAVANTDPKPRRGWW